VTRTGGPAGGAAAAAATAVWLGLAVFHSSDS
jgi:hypothetical protein